MTKGDSQYVLGILSGARCVEDIFGTEANIEAVAESYRQLVSQLTLDSEALIRLNYFYRIAQDQLDHDTYGSERALTDTRPGVKVVIRNAGELRVESQIAEGETSDIFTGHMFYPGNAMMEAAIKISRGNADDIRRNNVLLKNEANALRELFKEDEKTGSLNPNLEHLPKMLGQFQTGKKQLANVLKFAEGYDFYDIRESKHHKQGVSVEHLVWIMSRVFSLLGYVHSRGIIHGNIKPEHLIVTPRNHNVTLISWGHSVRPGQPFTTPSSAFSAPEVEKRTIPTPSTDIYALGKSIVYLAGDGIVPSKIKHLIDWMTMESPLQRPRDAYEVGIYLEETREELWGPKQFLQFDV